MKLAGALLWIVVAVGLIAGVGVAGFIFAFDRVQELGLKYEIAVAFITIWSVVFVFMTLLRMPATPVVSCSGLVVWIVYRLAVALLTAGWPLIIDVLGEIALVAGFCGYMAGGAAPSTYYRRRLPGA